MIVTIESPPVMATGNADLDKITSYLFRTLSILGDAINGMTVDKLVEQGGKDSYRSINKGVAQTPGANRNEYEALKSLIIKTADVIRTEMDVLFTSLSGLYVAQSEFGEYKLETNNAITANSTGIQQNYQYLSELTDATDQHRIYITQTQAYIRTGLLDDTGGEAIYGVEIGQQNEGEAPFKARITAQRMGFWQGNTEVAYISNNRWHTRGLDVEEDISLHDEWGIYTENNCFVINYTGA